jgi:hypothetical protein
MLPPSINTLRRPSTSPAFTTTPAPPPLATRRAGVESAVGPGGLKDTVMSSTTAFDHEAARRWPAQCTPACELVASLVAFAHPLLGFSIGTASMNVFPIAPVHRSLLSPLIPFDLRMPWNDTLRSLLSTHWHLCAVQHRSDPTPTSLFNIVSWSGCSQCFSLVSPAPCPNPLTDYLPLRVHPCS